MKQKDIALIIFIVGISMLLSFFVSKAVFVKPKNRQQQVEVVQAIDTKFPPTSDAYFNDKAFDPAQPITIGENANPDPFTNKSQ